MKHKKESKDQQQPLNGVGCPPQHFPSPSSQLSNAASQLAAQAAAAVMQHAIQQGQSQPFGGRNPFLMSAAANGGGGSEGGGISYSTEWQDTEEREADYCKEWTNERMGEGITEQIESMAF